MGASTGCVALEAAAEENPQAIHDVIPDLVAFLVAFDGLPDDDDRHWTATEAVRDYVGYALLALETVAEREPDLVLATFEPHGGIESVTVPGWSDRLSELEAVCDG